MERSAYIAYLKSPHWQWIRKRAIKDAHYMCQRCGGVSPDGSVDVHHLNYDHVGREWASDLVVLCRECHEKADEHRHWHSRVRGWAKKVFGHEWHLHYGFDEVEMRFTHWLERKGLL